MYLGIKIVFISLTLRQKLISIVHENVKWENVLFYYNLQLYIEHICLKLDPVKL